MKRLEYTAPTEEDALRLAVERSPTYEEYEVIGHTPASSSGPGFWTVLAFDTHEEYQIWLADNDE